MSVPNHTAPPAAARQDVVERVWAALQDVEDPEFPMSIVDMGLVIEVELEDQTLDMMHSLEALHQILSKLTDLLPDDAFNGDV